MQQRNYIIEWTDGYFTDRNPVITKELCESFAKKRVDNGKDWNDSPVSKKSACRHCNGTGVIHMEGNPETVAIAPILNKRGNVRTDKRRDKNGNMVYTEKSGPVKRANVRWSEACVCVKRAVEKLEKLDANALIMGEFND